MTSKEEFPPLPARKPRDPATKITSMDTDPPSLTTPDDAKCTHMRQIHDIIIMNEMNRIQIEGLQRLMNLELVTKNQSDLDKMTKDADDIKGHISNQKDTSFANALKDNQKLAPPPEKPKPGNFKPEAAPIPSKGKRHTSNECENESFGFMEAVVELKKLFTDYPSLLELGRQLRNAKGAERINVFYRHLMNLNY
ncbi:hypothetical protein TNCV_2285831 [Trichonephila clavipes]|nr:hypothetical protein TNCV_2285831 [Trichonephila clavipes]